MPKRNASCCWPDDRLAAPKKLTIVERSRWAIGFRSSLRFIMRSVRRCRTRQLRLGNLAALTAAADGDFKGDRVAASSVWLRNGTDAAHVADAAFDAKLSEVARHVNIPSGITSTGGRLLRLGSRFR